ncbi:EamA family transporter [Roseburia inulinivorans]
MTLYIFLFVFSVFISSVSQTILKTSAEKKYDNRLQEYLNPKVIIAYGIFFLSSLITVVAYKYVPLSLGPILESCGYIFITLLGYFILHEKVGKKKLIGLIVILMGISIFNMQ